MYNEGRAVVKDVQKTIGEVKAIGKEVTGILGWIKNFFAEPATDLGNTQELKPTKKEKVKFDEKAIYTEIGDKLVVFFKNFRDCAEAIQNS